MARLTKSQKQTDNILNQLAPEEAVTLLRVLLDKHPEWRAEIEEMGQEVMSSPASSEDIAEAVLLAVTGLDLDALNGRAGKHSWGYVEPGEAAQQLLEEAVEDWFEEMKLKLEADFVPAAQAICIGVVAGLHRAEIAKSQGVLGWAPDFAADYAGYVLQEFLQLSRYKMKKDERVRFFETIVAHATRWEGMLRRIMGF